MGGGGMSREATPGEMIGSFLGNATNLERGLGNGEVGTTPGKYKPYESRALNGGEQHRYRFENGYEASLIRGPYT
jgi:hypothetical protein